MSHLLSNALSSLWSQTEAFCPAAGPATRAATGPAAETAQQATIPPELYGLLAVGLVVDMVLLAWFIRRRIVRPAGRFGITRTPGRTNMLNPLHLIGLLGILLATTGLLNELLSPPLPEMKANLLADFGGRIVLIGGCILVASLCFTRGAGRGMGLKSRHWLIDILRGGIAYLAVLPACFALLAIGTLLLGKHEHPLLKCLSTMAPEWQVLAAFSAIVMAPLSEELFFRGIVQSTLRRYGIGPTDTIFLASAFFAVVHVPAAPQSVPALFVLGLVLGYNYERTGRLLPAIIIHAIFNAVSVFVVLSKV